MPATIEGTYRVIEESPVETISEPIERERAEPTQTESPFIPGSSIQWAWDSTSLGLFKACPRKYFYAQIRGLKRKRHTADVKKDWGSAFHKGLETWELVRYENPRARALEITLEAARNAALGMGEDPYGKRTVETLLRSLTAYIERHEQSPLTTTKTINGEPAVELSFQLPYGSVVWDQQPILYCGHFDRIVDFQGNTYVLDSKTTGASISTEKGAAAYFAQFTPDNQFTGYTWAAHEGFGIPVRGVIVDAMQVAKTKNEFAREVIHRTPAQVAEWHQESIAWMRLAAASSYSATTSNLPIPDQARFFPMNDQSCHKFGGCQFRGVCGRDPSVRENFIATDFEVKPWNPLASRNDGEVIEAESTED